MLCVRVKCPSGDTQCHKNKDAAYPKNHTDRFDGKGSDTVDGKIKHLPERILRFSGKTLVTIVVHAVRLVADEGNQPSKKKVALAEAA